MSQVSKHFMNPKIAGKVYDVFINSIKNSRSKNEVISFLDDLLSLAEKTMLAKRVAIATSYWKINTHIVKFLKS